MKFLLECVYVCSRENEYDSSTCAGLQAPAADHPASRPSSRYPHDNDVDRRLPSRHDIAPPLHSQPHSRDFRKLWDLRPAGVEWQLPNIGRQSLDTAVCSQGPCQVDNWHPVYQWHHSPSTMPAEAGADHWVDYEPSYCVNQFASFDAHPFHHTLSFSRTPAYHGWTNGHVVGGQMNGPGCSGQQWDQQSEWISASSRRKRHCQKPRYHRRYHPGSRLAANANNSRH